MRRRLPDHRVKDVRTASGSPTVYVRGYYAPEAVRGGFGASMRYRRRPLNRNLSQPVGFRRIGSFRRTDVPDGAASEVSGSTLRPSVSGCMMPSVIMEVVMGGTGSGAYRSTRVANVEDVLALDVRVLRRLGALRPRECIITDIHWSLRGLSVLEARLRADMRDDSGTINLRGRAISQDIALEATAAGFGGRRCYLLCPISGARSEVLYLVDDQFASRQGHRLSYSTQNMTDLSRSRRKAAKLRARLAGEEGFVRPRGRNRIVAVERLDLAQVEARDIYVDRLRRYAARSGTQR